MRPATTDFLLIILSSPSGAGKTTLCNRLRGEFPQLRFSISHTTRKPRPTEVDGREYHFVTEGEFQTMVKMGAFAEHACVHGNYYGTSLREIEIARAASAPPTLTDQHRWTGVLFDIDYQGARQIKANFPDAIGIFVLPPSLGELERRLRGRGTEDEPTTQRRLEAAKREIEHYGFFDYVVVNDDVDSAFGRLRGIVLAERCRRERHALLCESLLSEADPGKAPTPGS